MRVGAAAPALRWAQPRAHASSDLRAPMLESGVSCCTPPPAR